MSSDVSPKPISFSSVAKELTVLGIPASIASLAEPLMEAVDTVIAGHIGITEIAALGLAVSLILFIVKGFNFLYFGTVSRSAVTWGRGDMAALHKYMWVATIIALGLGTVLGVLVYVGAPWFLQWSHTVPSLHGPAQEYFQARAWSVPALLLMYTGLGLFRGLGKNVVPLVMVLGSTVSNALLNILFVFGLHLGMTGLAWGTNIALWLLVAGYYGWAWYGLGVRIPPVGDRMMPLNEFVQTFAFALPMIGRSLCLTGAIAVFAVAAAQISEVAGATHYVVAQIVFLISNIVEGQMVTIQSLIGQEYGNKAYERIGLVAKYSLWYSVLASALITIPLVIFITPLIGIFSSDPTVLHATLQVYWLPVGLTFMHYLTYAHDSMIMGIEDFKTIAWATIGAGFAGGLFALGIVQVVPSLLLVWVGYEVLMVLRLIPQAVVFRQFMRAHVTA